MRGRIVVGVQALAATAWAAPEHSFHPSLNSLMRFLFPLILLLALAGCTTQTQQADPTLAADVATGTVTVEITMGENTQSIAVDGVADGETVESVMRKIEGVDVSVSGSGTTAFVNKIGDQPTENGEGWTYTIDGERAERGIGATTLSPPTTVSWKYGQF